MIDDPTVEELKPITRKDVIAVLRRRANQAMKDGDEDVQYLVLAHHLLVEKTPKEAEDQIVSYLLHYNKYLRVDAQVLSEEHYHGIIAFVKVLKNKLRKERLFRKRFEWVGTLHPSYEQIAAVVYGVVKDTMHQHPEYFTETGQRGVYQSLAKRLIGALKTLTRTNS